MSTTAQLIDDLKSNRTRACETFGLREASLACADLSGVDLSGADLYGADLSGAVLFKANLQGANLCGANLCAAELTGANLRDANMSEATANKAGLGMADLSNANLLNANLEDCTLSQANLSGADLRCARLQRGRLREACLEGADLTGADLRGVDMSLSKVGRATFNNADLRQARLRQIQGYRAASWTGVDLRDINFAGAYDLRRFVIDQNYLKEFRQRNRLCAAMFWVWSITSDCGRSLTLWCAWILMVTFAYAGLYTVVDVDYGNHHTWMSPLYYSVVTMSTLGYGDVVPSSPAAQGIAMLQVITGYVMLGVLLTLFNDKLARRRRVSVHAEVPSQTIPELRSRAG